MEVRILGAHCRETPTTRMTALLIDGVLAVDAGGLTSTLSLPEQEGLEALLLTHRHYDHIRDLPILALNTLECGKTLPVYAPPDTLLHLQSHLLDGSLYPNFTIQPSVDRPRLRLFSAEPLRPFSLLGYQVVAVPASHPVPAVGYEFRTPEGKRAFFTGDTGPGLLSSWEREAPDLLLVEVTYPDRREERARSAGHLTPSLLGRDLEALQQKTGRLPRVVALHLSPEHEEEIREALARLSQALGGEIEAGQAGMVLRV